MTGKLRLGTLSMGGEIGRPDDDRLYVWGKCPNCKKRRWFRREADHSTIKICKACSAKVAVSDGRHISPSKGQYREKNSQWKGGMKRANGYILVKLNPTDQFFAMANCSGYVFAHRLIMAESLGRLLLPWEVVHHKNGAKDDNGLNNLELLPHGRFHLVDTKTKAYIKQLEKRVKKLEAKCHQDVTLNVDIKDKGVHR